MRKRDEGNREGSRFLLKEKKKKKKTQTHKFDSLNRGSEFNLLV